MRKCYKTFGNLLAFCIFVCSLVCFASCGDDSGLGSVIDTKAPTLSIDYPPSGASIRDTFILEGTCSDDISISTVMVTVKNLDTGETVGTFPAVVNPLTRTWSLNINAHNPAAPNFYNGWQYPDGKYEVSVVAYDFAGNNSGTNSRSFELDNTPPVFIISNPGVVKKSGLSASAYGSVFTIDGTIADNHTISFMDVKIFDANGVLVSSESYEGENIDFYREQEIPTAGGTSVQIAQFGNARYTQLHPSDAGTEYYYAQISVTDSTQCYQNPPVGSLRTLEQIAADKIGNNTSKLYLYDDVYSTLMSAKKGINSANGGLSAANLKDILAGIRKGDIETRALEILNEKGIDTSLPTDSDEHGNKLSFSLNPQANPTYNVNGFAFGFGDDEITQSASTGNTISVTVNAGLDGTNIAPGVIKVWMKTYESKPTDAVAIKNELNSLEKKVEALEKEEQAFMDLTNKTAESPATTIDNWSLVYDYSLNNPQGSSVATKTFSVTLPEGIELGKYYILGITGYDIEDVVFSQSTVYGFEGNTAGVPPTINIDTPDNLSVWKDFAAPSFSGSASISTSALYITELTATLSLTDENNNNALGEFSDKITCKLESDSKVWTESEKHALTWNSDENKWYLDLSKIPELVQFYNDRAGAGVYWLATLKLSGKSSSGHEGESTRSIHIDTVAPVISLTSITPIVSGADYFGGGDTETYVNGIITIKGNVEEQNLLDTEDAVTYDILASTDGSAPVSILSQLIARKDELGVAFDGKLGKTFSLSIPFDTRAITKFFYPDGDGKVQTEVVVTATDKAGNKTSYSSKTLNGGKNYIVYQETDRPQISLGNADASITSAANVKVNKNLFGTTSNNRIQINFTDDDDIAEYEFYLYNEAGTLMGASEVKAQSDGSTANPYKFTPGKTTATLNYILPSVEAKYQVEIKARDYLVTGLNTANPYGEKTVGRFFVAVDSGAPEIEISTPVAGSFQSSNVSIVGTVSKSVELTGTLQKGGVNVVDPFTIPASDLTLDSSTGLYSFSKTVTVTENDAYVIGISATDIYDQNATKSRVFKVDTQSPVIQSVATAGHLTTTNTERLIPLDEMEYLTLNADVTDGDPTAVSGISVVKYYITTNSTVDLAATPFDGNDWLQMNQGQTNDSYVTSFNANVAVKKFAAEKGYYDGLVYIFVATKDNAGNPVAVSSPITLTFDKTVPKLTVKNFAGNTDLENNGTSTTTNPSATFNVNIEDTNIASLTSDNTAVVVGSTPDEITGGKRYTITPSWNVDSSSGKYEDEKTVTFTAKDTYYREATKTVTLKCDNWAPRVTLTRTDADRNSKSNAIELKGSIRDKNVTGIANNLKLYFVPLDSAFETKDGLITFSPLANGEAGYNYTANITGLSDTKYNIAIVAEDSFGNKSLWSTDASSTTAVTGTDILIVTDIGELISIDQTAPVANVQLKVSNASGDAKVLNSGKAVVNPSVTATDWNTYSSENFESKYYTNRTFKISGTITEGNLVYNDADVEEAGTDANGAALTKVPSLTIVKEDSTGRNSMAVGAGEFVVDYENKSGNEIPWSFTKTYAEDGSADGLYEYTLEVWDKSKQQFKKTITVVLDTKIPELAITNPSDGESFDATKPAVKISYSDEGVGVDTDTTDSSNYIVKIFNITELADSTSIDTFNSETPLTPSEFTILSSSATARLDNLSAEGAFRVFAQVRDNLGHTSAVETRRFSYDSNPPIITETIVGNGGLKTNGYDASGSIANGLAVKNFMLRGSVSDTNALYNKGVPDSNGKTAVRITASKDGTSAGEWKIPLTVTDKRNATWEQVFVIGSENAGNSNPSYIYLEDGVYTFSIVATDIADKETAITRTVTVDTVKPVITSPVINAQTFTFGSGTTEEIWYNSDSIGIGGSANDGTDGTGIQKVYYKTTGDNGTTWSNVTTLAGTSSWSGTVGGLVSKTTKIRVIAVDNAGNESDPYDFGTFNIDITEPSAENASMTFASGDGKIFDSSKTEVTNNTLIFEKTYYTGNAFTLSGEFTELNVDTSTDKAPTLSVSKDGGAQTSVTLTPVQVAGTTDRWTWTYNSPNDIANGSNDGTYKYTLTVTDKVNHVLTKTFEVVVDTKAPTLTIESPTANEAFSKAPTVQVSYSDAGVGINTNEIEYKIYKITDTSSETEVSVSGQKTAGSENGKFKFDDSFNDESNEGKYKVTAKIKDYLGHESTVASQTFFFDKNKPVLTDINIGLSGLQTNGLADDGTKPNGLNAKNFKLSGRVSDSNALYDNGTYHSSTTEKNVITISASNGGTSVGSWNIPVTLDDSGNSKKSGSWEKIFVVGSDTLSGYDQLADGTYTFTITALDVVEKDAIETRTVTVDTQAPTLSTPTVTTAQGNNGWFKTDELGFTGTSNDGTGTGVQTVYYQTSTDGREWTGSKTTTAFAGTSTWTGTVPSLVSGSTRVRIVAVDNAGNESISAELGPYNIDMVAPNSDDVKLNFASGATGMVVNSSKHPETATDGKYSLAFGNTYYTGTAFTLSGEFVEANIHSATLTRKKNGGAEEIIAYVANNANPAAGNWSYTSTGVANIWAWTYTIPDFAANNADDGQYEYTLTIEDKVGFRFSKSVFVIVDTKKPTLEITNPASDEESFEGKPIVKLSYSDDGIGVDNTVASGYAIIEIYNITDTTETTNKLGSDQYDFTSLSSTATATFNVDATTPEGKFKAVARVRDYLGHESDPVERVFNYDKANPLVNVDASSVPSSGLMTNGGSGTGASKKFTISGTVSDSNALYMNGGEDTNGKTAVTISTVIGGTERKWNVPVTHTVKTSGSWTQDFLVGSGNNSSSNTNYIPDGSYTFTIVATDNAGKTSQLSRAVTVDTVAPRFGTEEPPEASSTTTSTNVKPHVSTTAVTSGSEKWYKTNELRFAGNADDKVGGVEGTGIQTVYYQTSTNGIDWTGSKDTTAFAGTSSWAGTVPSLESGKTRVRVIVIDNAGNESAPVDLNTFNIDMTPPESTVALANTGTGTILGSSKTTATSFAFGSTYYTNGKFTLSGKITELNIDPSNKPVLRIVKDSTTTPVNLTENNPDSTTGTWTYAPVSGSQGEFDWTYTIPDFAANNADDGQYVYTLTFKDKVGNEFSKSVTVIVDTKNPELSVTSPAPDESFESSPTARIAYSDSGVGINSAASDAVTYSVKNITDSATGTDVDSSNYDVSNGSATGSLTFKNTYDSEGSFTFTATVKDYLGHETTSDPRTFYYDKSKPSVDETNVGNNGLTTNGGTEKKFTLRGTVSDTNGLYNGGETKTVTESGVTKTLAPITVSATVGGVEKTWPLSVTTTDKKNGTWSIDFVVGSENSSATNYIPDGSYTFTIVATDVANKTSQISRTVTVDTVVPLFGTGTKDTTSSEYDSTDVEPHVSTEPGTKTVGAITEEWFKTDTLRFEGTASDGTGTGIKEIYYYKGTVTGTNSHHWDTTKKTFAGTTSWAGTIENLVSKSSVIKVVAVDNAGNTKESDVLGPFNIDTTEPTLTSGSVKVNDQPASEESPFYSSGVKGNTAATVTFKVSDETNGSGIQKVDVQIYGKAITTETSTPILATVAASDDGSYSATIPATSITKSGTAYARIYDYAGNYSDVNLFALTYDASNPAIQSASLTDSSDYTAYKPNQNVDKYYVNNTNGNFTLSGIATDNLGLKSAKLELKEGDDVKKTYEITNEAQLSEWSFAIGNDLKTGFATTETSPLIASLTVTDKAGNKATKDISIVFDTIKPAALHDWDSGSTSKDAVFRIGEDNNDLKELKTWRADHTSLTDADKDVGGKYAPGTYGKANTITVRGYFTEEGSGLQYVYYKVFSQATPPQESEITAFVTDYKNQKTGFFSAITEETKNVKFNTSDSTYEFKEDVKTNFKSTISEFGIGKNYLVLVGVDYVGNAAVDGISYMPDGSSPALNCYSINVDVEAPTVERTLADGESSTLLTNASSDALVLNGTAIDNPTGNAAGIKSLSASIKVKESSGTENTYTSTDTDPQITLTSNADKTTWSVKVKKEIFENVDAGNFNVYVTATDYAGTGNSQTSNVGTISVDKIAPTVTLALPTDADPSTPEREINGVIDLSGTVKDANPLPEKAILGIQYIKKDDYTETDDSESAGTKWVTLTNDYKGESGKEMSALSLSGDYTFDIKNFDTTKIEPLDDVVYYIRAKATDQAGNIGYSPITESNGNFIEITISQDSDRPVVNITNLTDLGAGATPRFVLKYGTKSQVIATISDDDGIDKVYLTEAEYKGTSGETAPSAVMSAYSETNGTVTFTPQDDINKGKNVDGSKSFYIYVKDKAGNVFYTTYYNTAEAAETAKYLKVPKVKLGSFHKNTSDIQEFTYQSDSTSPVVENIQALAYKADGTTMNGGMVVTGSGTSATVAYTDFEGVNAGYIIGGTEKQKAQFKLTATDASGIDGIALEISYTEVDGTTETAKTLKYRSKESDVIGDSTYTLKGTFATDTTDATKSTWTTDIIDFSKAKTGSVSVKVIPYDKLGLVGNGNATFVVDNSAPPINITAPASGAEKTGAVSIVGTSYDGNAGTSNIQWLIPTRDDVTAANATSSESARFEYLKNLKVTVDGTEKSKWNGGTASLASGTSVSVSSWQFDFDGSYDSTKSNASNFIFASGNPKFDLYDSETFASSINDGVYTIPIYFMATDSLGNYTIKEDYVICHNPDGDRPKVEFTYPTTKDYDKNSSGTSLGYATLGGTIRVTGSAEIPSNTTTVKNVYLQIADSSAGFTGTAAASTEGTDSYKAKNTYGYNTIVSAYDVIKEIKGTSYTSTITFTDAELKALGFSSKDDLDNWWGIKTNGTASWNIALNDDGKMNPSGDGTNDIAIRACGVNAEGKFGAWTQGDNVIAIHVDNKAPTVTYEVNQYSSDVTTSNASTSLTAIVTQSYEPDMFLRGQWYLVLDILDESGIGSLTVRNNGRELTNGTDYFEVALIQTSPAKTGFKIFVKIDKTATSETYTVTAVDKDTGSSPHTTTQTFSFNIDNTAPSMESITANGKAFSTDNLVQNTNFKFTLAGKSTDEGSGVDRVVFYYMRKNGVTKNGETAITIDSDDEVILNPMIAPTGSNYTAVKVPMNETGIEKLEIEQDASHKYELYAQKISGTATTTTFAGTFHDHVRVGGLVTFDKTIYRRITAKTDSSVSFEPALTSALGTVTAYFPIAQVIDNSATEKTSSDSANPFTFEKGDDGDKMPESFSKSGKTWTWDASIHSDNLPDGPISLVILAFDEAGNVNGTTVNTFVSNNAPRVAKLFLATDLNDNNKFETDEFEEYSLVGKEGKSQDKYILDFSTFGTKYGAGIFTAKNKLAVVPEIVGGNGSISLVTRPEVSTVTSAEAVTKAVGTELTLIASGSSTATTTQNDDGVDVTTYSASVARTESDDISPYTITASNFAASDVGNNFFAYVLDNNQLTGKTNFSEDDDGEEKNLSFTFWDSTDLTERGTDSQKAVILVKGFTYDLTDGKAPTTVINPFYWNGIKENSIYDSASASTSTDLKGHIEFEDDLTDDIKNFDAESTAYGSDPKVSGIVTFTGTAYDEHALSEITFSFGSYMSGTIATYKSEDSTWTAGTGTLASDGWKATVSSEAASSIGYYGDDTYFGQRGHKVYWTLSIDTEKISDVAKLDVVLSVTAKDLKENVTSTDAADVSTRAESNGDHSVTDGTTNLPTYQMDVVPYIVGVKTSLSSLKKNRSSVYDRTALGHYPVASTETIYVYGFNLNGGSLADNASNWVALTKITPSTSYKWYSEKAAPVASVYSAGSIENFKSGTLWAYVEGVWALNNFNDNDAKDDYEKTTTSATGDYSIYANYPNRQPNNDSNNNLTDDVILDVWKFNSGAAVVKQSGYITEPIMKINPKNNMVGFAFNNGPAYYSMANGSGTSYSLWQRNFARNSTSGFTIDENGVTHGITVGLDTNPNSNDAGRMTYMTSAWGPGTTNNQDGNYNGYHTSRIESIGAPKGTYNGVTFSGTVILEDRFSSPSLATTVHGSSTYVFLAYYDDLNGQIRFRYGDLSKASPNSDGTTGYTFDQFADQTSNGRDTGNNDVFESKANYYSVLASNTVNDNDARAGNYVSIAAIKGTAADSDVVVATWYDAQNNKWWYSYKKNPCNDNDMSTTHADGYWASPILLKDEAGENCQITVDAVGGIHIASYDTTNADLLYAYLSSYSDTTPSLCTVDSYAFAGTNIMIDAAISADGNYVVPYISYYMSSTQKPKIAHLPNVISASTTATERESVTIPKGAEDDYFTTRWESSIIPTSSRYADNYSYSYVNVAVWKDSSGKITSPSAAQSSSKTSNVNGDTGYCYGNGTSNPIVGYAIREGTKGYLETAQMK